MPSPLQGTALHGHWQTDTSAQGRRARQGANTALPGPLHQQDGANVRTAQGEGRVPGFEAGGDVNLSLPVIVYVRVAAHGVYFFDVAVEIGIGNERRLNDPSWMCEVCQVFRLPCHCLRQRVRKHLERVQGTLLPLTKQYKQCQASWIPSGHHLCTGESSFAQTRTWRSEPDICLSLGLETFVEILPLKKRLDTEAGKMTAQNFPQQGRILLERRQQVVPCS